MKRYLLLVCLVAVSLACQTPLLSVQPKAAPTATRLPVTATRQITPTATRSATWTAKVRRPVVNVRKTADGVPSGKYLIVGNSVTVLRCEDNWCEIKDPAGWVFIGCLDDSVNVSHLGCEAK